MTYRQCTRCIMDTTDPEITFDDRGVCNHCRRFDEELRPLWRPNAEGRQRLEKSLNRIAPKLPAQDHPAGLVNAVNLKDVLG